MYWVCIYVHNESCSLFFLTQPRRKLQLKKSFLSRSALPTCQEKSSGDTGWRHYQWNLWPKKLKVTGSHGHSKLNRVSICFSGFSTLACPTTHNWWTRLSYHSYQIVIIILTMVFVLMEMLDVLNLMTTWLWWQNLLRQSTPSPTPPSMPLFQTELPGVKVLSWSWQAGVLTTIIHHQHID